MSQPKQCWLVTWFERIRLSWSWAQKLAGQFYWRLQIMAPVTFWGYCHWLRYFDHCANLKCVCDNKCSNVKDDGNANTVKWVYWWASVKRIAKGGGECHRRWCCPQLWSKSWYVNILAGVVCWCLQSENGDDDKGSDSLKSTKNVVFSSAAVSAVSIAITTTVMLMKMVIWLTVWLKTAVN